MISDSSQKNQSFCLVPEITGRSPERNRNVDCPSRMDKVKPLHATGPRLLEDLGIPNHYRMTMMKNEYLKAHHTQ
jgi:hypothetical protein